MEPHELHMKSLLIDGHSDLLNDVIHQRTLDRSKVIEEDWLPDMRAGGIDIRVAAIYSDNNYIPEIALRRGLDLVVALTEEIEASEDLVLCKTSSDIRNAKKEGKVGFILGMEGSEPLGMDINLLRIFHMLGLRVLGFTHGLRTYAADPAYFMPTETGKEGGLSDFGIRLVHEANREA